MSRECCRCTSGPCRRCMCAQWGQSCTNCLSTGCQNRGWLTSQYSPNQGQYEQRVKTIAYKKNGFGWSTTQTTHTYRQENRQTSYSDSDVLLYILGGLFFLAFWPVILVWWAIVYAIKNSGR